jgi:hypothetical protein
MLARGHFSVLAASTPTLKLGVYYGTDANVFGNDTQIGALTPVGTAASGATNQFFQLDFSIVCFSNIAMNGQGTYTFQNNATATTTMAIFNVLSTTNSTVTSTTAKNLYIFPTWSANQASNTATLDQLIVTGN